MIYHVTFLNGVTESYNNVHIFKTNDDNYQLILENGSYYLLPKVNVKSIYHDVN